MKAIEIVGISKTYGSRPALDKVSFDVEEGDAVALIGPNGAGKTTLLRILATLLKPTAGYVRVLGEDGRFRASAIRRLIGYMPDGVAMEEDMNVKEYLEFFAGLHGLEPARRENRVKDVVELLELGGVLERACAALSRGMQQRLGLARTLLHNPAILILDEPAANLDPRSRVEIREVIKELRSMGKTVVVSSHILMELGEFCNKLLVLQAGRVLYSGGIAEVAGKLRAGRRFAVRVSGDAPRLAELLRSERAAREVTEADGWVRVSLADGVEDPTFIVRRAVQEGYGVLGFREEEVGLEEVFMRLTQPGGPR